ncbi:B-cell receptor CD22-like [Dendropsophus ebraccatus]|uniref:B-cell receptor CD22-like n=1 Tax=Dendropsophus ebraccatus TaxID=150705 RepID=UPI0038311BA8
MEAVKQVYLLLICQGFYLGSVSQRWTFPRTTHALLGSCVEIPCTYDPAGTSETSSTVWFLYYNYDYKEILNTQDPSSVIEKYRGRTSLVPGNNSCTLRIDPVRREDGDKAYYPGIIEDTNMNPYKRPPRGVSLSVSDTDTVYADFYVSEEMSEGEATTMYCTAEHSCRSSPPSLQYNKPGKVTHQSEEISGGSWREESQLTYMPSFVDDGSPVQCTATFPNGQKSERSVTLNIKYPPKHVTVTIIGKDEVLEGSDVTLQCNGFSKPDVSWYDWYKGKEKTRLPGSGREITVRNVTRDMEPYSCTARNFIGKGESALTHIPVLSAPTGVHITMKNEGEFPALICDFLSSRPDVTHYTWMKDGSILHNETEKTLTLLNNGDNNGQYSCIAHNKVGYVSSEEIWIKHEGFNISTIVLVAISGAICLLLLLLVLLIYCCWRERCQKSKSNESETSPDATYTTLVKRETESDYEQYK